MTKIDALLLTVVIWLALGIGWFANQPATAALPKQSTLIDIRNRDTVTVVARGADYSAALEDAHARISQIAQHFGIAITREFDSLESIREVPASRGVQLEVTFYCRASILTSALAPRPAVVGERAVRAGGDLPEGRAVAR